MSEAKVWDPLSASGSSLYVDQRTGAAVGPDGSQASLTIPQIASLVAQYLQGGTFDPNYAPTDLGASYPVGSAGYYEQLAQAAIKTPQQVSANRVLVGADGGGNPTFDLSSLLALPGLLKSGLPAPTVTSWGPGAGTTAPVLGDGYIAGTYAITGSGIFWTLRWQTTAAPTSGGGGAGIVCTFAWDAAVKSLLTAVPRVLMLPNSETTSVGRTSALMAVGGGVGCYNIPKPTRTVNGMQLNAGLGGTAPAATSEYALDFMLLDGF